MFQDIWNMKHELHELKDILFWNPVFQLTLHQDPWIHKTRPVRLSEGMTKACHLCTWVNSILEKCILEFKKILQNISFIEDSCVHSNLAINMKINKMKQSWFELVESQKFVDAHVRFWWYFRLHNNTTSQPAPKASTFAPAILRLHRKVEVKSCKFNGRNIIAVSWLSTGTFWMNHVGNVH